jgi:hypothetical protein
MVDQPPFTVIPVLQSKKSTWVHSKTCVMLELSRPIHRSATSRAATLLNTNTPSCSDPPAKKLPVAVMIIEKYTHRIYAVACSTAVIKPSKANLSVFNKCNVLQYVFLARSNISGTAKQKRMQ